MKLYASVAGVSVQVQAKMSHVGGSGINITSAWVVASCTAEAG
jgi:hypothetical protein